jgi:hypothetical protein
VHYIENIQSAQFSTKKLTIRKLGQIVPNVSRCCIKVMVWVRLRFLLYFRGNEHDRATDRVSRGIYLPWTSISPYYFVDPPRISRSQRSRDELVAIIDPLGRTLTHLISLLGQSSRTVAHTMWTWICGVSTHSSTRPGSAEHGAPTGRCFLCTF